MWFLQRNFKLFSLIFLLLFVGCSSSKEFVMKEKKPLVFMSDFGLKERFVASMKGVALSVDENLKIYDLTHLIEPFNIWEASNTLAGTIEYWPKGTVFVSVVDPGVGTKRKSVVLKTQSGYYIVTPDNGTLTQVAEQEGIEAIREIDEKINRRKNSEDSHTFHGRDVYAFTGARLASGGITFEQVGKILKPEVVKLKIKQPQKIDKNIIVGTIVKVELPFGNIVTNIPKIFFDESFINTNDLLKVEIKNNNEIVFNQNIKYVNSFGFVKVGEPLVYSDSQQWIGLAVNNGNFSKQYSVKSGTAWMIIFSKLK
jgi:S-adenosylmethionine hydrolase